MDMDTPAFQHRMESLSVVEDMDTRHLDTFKSETFLPTTHYSRASFFTYKSIPIVGSRATPAYVMIYSNSAPYFALPFGSTACTSLMTKPLCVNQIQPCDIRPHVAFL